MYTDLVCNVCLKRFFSHLLQGIFNLVLLVYIQPIQKYGSKNNTMKYHNTVKNVTNLGFYSAPVQNPWV